MIFVLKFVFENSQGFSKKRRSLSLNVEVHLGDIISINILWYPNVKSNLVCAARLSQKSDSKKTRAFFHDWSGAIILRYRIESNQKKILFSLAFCEKNEGCYERSVASQIKSEEKWALMFYWLSLRVFWVTVRFRI